MRRSSQTKICPISWRSRFLTEFKPKISMASFASSFRFLAIIIAIFSLTIRANGQILLWYDNLSDFPANWTIGGSGGPWSKDSLRYTSPSYSAKCTPDSLYANNQNNWMERNINLQGFQNGAVVFSIWQKTEPENDFIYFECYNGTWLTYWAKSGIYPAFEQRVITNIPNNVSKIRFRFQSNSSNTDEGVYIDDIYAYGYRYDVGCSLIVTPTGIVDSGQVITPQAVIYNYGDFISTFTVRMQIGSFYTNDQTVTNLEPKTSRTINFANWTARQRGTWVVSCSTRHPADYDRTNDKKTTTVTVRVRDVGVSSILAPSGTIDSGITVVPQARVRNYGTTIETFNVRFTISPSYSSIRNITLAAGESLLVNFDDWTALPRGTLFTKCTTILNGDMVPANNFRSGSVTVRVRDVGVTEIVAPAGDVDSSQSLVPSVKVKNFGTHQENFLTIFQINGASGFWTNIKPVANLNPQEERLISFDQWPVGPRGSYSTRCSTALAGDQINANDQSYGSFTVQVHDVGVTRIISPFAADSSAIAPVSAMVKNYGTYPETFSVRFRINDFYASTQMATVNPNDSLVVHFDDWTVLTPRGSYLTGCSTLLSADANPNNNHLAGSVTVGVHDVGVVTIVSPLTADSSEIVPVEATVMNYGTYPETFSVRFRISDCYVSTRTTTLNPSSQELITFDDWWVTQPRGNYVTNCSTFLNTDANPNNDEEVGLVTVGVSDVGVVTIVSPLTADSSTTVMVSAQLMNYGTRVETFPVNFKIGDFYSDTRTVTLEPGSQELVFFANWTVTQPRGDYPTKCSTLLNNDVNPVNNNQIGTVAIGVHDVGVKRINGLPATVDSGAVVRLTATVANYGTDLANLVVRLRIGDEFTSQRHLVLNPGDSGIVIFDDYQALIRGEKLVICTTILANDANPTNDFQTGVLFVQVGDVGAIGILAPQGSVTQGTTVRPTALIKNFGNIPGTFSVWFKIVQDGLTFYQAHRTASLNPGAIDTIQFASWQTTGLGDFTLLTYLDWSMDMNPTNDTFTSSFFVEPYTAWIQKTNLPIGAKGKKVKAGGSLVFVPDSFVYALKGNNTQEFYRYHIGTEEWDSLSPMPLGEKPKRVKSGAALAYANGAIYALKGNNTQEFFRYSIAKNLWQRLKPVPLGPNNKKIKGGSGLVYASKGDSNFIFLLKGSKTYEFYAYWIDGDTWLERNPAPALTSGKPYFKGSALTYDGGNRLYALKNRTNEFYTYDIQADTWEERRKIPLYGLYGRKRQVKDGACLACDRTNLIYAFKGGNSDEYWAYELQADSWFPLTPIPKLPSNRKVRAGGALAFASSINRIFALKGNNTLEFWMYVPAPQFVNTNAQGKSDGIAEQAKKFIIPPGLKANIEITPNPFSSVTKISYQLPNSGPVDMKLFDANGRMVKQLQRDCGSGNVVLGCQNLKSGVYLLVIENGEMRVVKKLVLSKYKTGAE